LLGDFKLRIFLNR